MIRREVDAALVNRLANMPEVASGVSYLVGPLDFSPAVYSCCVISNGEDACGVFEPTGDGRWQSHTLFGPTCRGSKAIEVAREMVAWMLDRGAGVLWGATPINNPKARWFNRQIGAKVVGRDVYPADGDVEIFEIRSPN